MERNRRSFLQASSLAAIAAIAGCASPSSGGDDGGGGDGGGGTGAGSTTAAGTTAGTTAGGAPPGADVAGGPEDLRSSLTVGALGLDEDQGAGTFVFSPAVAWVEPGTTVTWEVEDAPHSVTAYAEANDRPARIPEGATAFDSGTLSAGETFEHTFGTEGVYDYFCSPHEALGMVGLVVVGAPAGGPGTTEPSEVESGAAADALSRLLETAGVAGAGGSVPEYAWSDATWDSYWYSLYNMSTNVAMSGNGITFPANESQRETFRQRVEAIAANADVDGPPIRNPNLNMAPFTEGDPRFTEKPVFDAGDGRPDASTLAWDPERSSKTVSPASVAWTHLKGVTWAKNFQKHFEVLPPDVAAKFRAQVLTTMAQLGVKFSLVDGKLRLNDENLLLGSAFRPGQGIVDEQPRPRQHAAMLWFLPDLLSLAQGEWFGYVNPEPLIPAENLAKLTNGMGKTVLNALSPGDVMAAEGARGAGLMLGGLGWFGTHATVDELRSGAAGFANGLAGALAETVDGNGKVADPGVENQAAAQGTVGQGLVWASQVEGVDHTGLAERVLGYMLDELWDPDAGTFATGTGASTYAITARDAGDVTGGLNAAEAELGMDRVREVYPAFFDGTFNRGRLQRAERPNSRDPEAEHTLPLPPAAGGEFGQAAVYNAAVEYDTRADEWTVTDDRFDTEAALYLANQDVWIGQWGGDFYQGRGVPGKSDAPP